MVCPCWKTVSSSGVFYIENILIIHYYGCYGYDRIGNVKVKTLKINYVSLEDIQLLQVVVVGDLFLKTELP